MLQPLVPDFPPSCLSEARKSEEELRRLRADLETRTAELAAARLAALSILRVAVAARKTTQAANARLSQESKARRHVEKALAKNERKQRRLFETSREALMTLFPPGWQFVSANAVAIQMFGAKDERDFTVLQPWEVSPEHQPDGELSSLKARRMIAIAMESGSHFFEWTHRRIDGEIFPATVMLTRVESGKKVGLQVMIRDMTRQKQAELALRQSEEKLRQIVEHSSQVFYSHSADNVLTYLSPQAMEFLDSSPSEAMQPWTDFLTDNPLNAEGIELTRLAIETGQQQHPYELELKSKQGRTVWVEVRESPVVVQGKTVAIVGALTDITERKQGEARKRAEEERYLRQRNALIAFAGCGACNAEDLTATIRRLTETDAKTLGVARVSVWRYNHDRTAIRCLDLYERNANQHTAGMELSAADYPAYFRALAALDVIAADDAHHDGRTCEFSKNYLRPLGITSMMDAPIRLCGNQEGVLCHEHVGPPRHWTADEQTFAIAVANLVSLALEGSERRRAEAELGKAHAQLAQMMAHSPAITYRHKVEGESIVPIAVSANIERLLGFPALPEMLNYEWWLAQLHPEDRELALDSVRELFREGTSRTEYRVRSKKGDYLWIEDNRRLIRDAAGQPMEIVGVWIDITDRKRSEFELKQTHNQLLAASRQAGMAEFANGVLHNVGNVLNSVNVASTCLSDSLKKSKSSSLSKVVTLMREHEADLGTFLSDDPKGKQLLGYLTQLAGHLSGEHTMALKELGELQRNVEHIKRIITLQQDSAKLSRSVETVNVKELIEETLKMNANAVQRGRIQVIQDYEEIPPILTDKHPVLQILVNLVRNAIQSCEGCSNPEKRMTLRVSQQTGRVRIAVADNGGGILPENLPRIFSQGFTTKKDGHGFGLHSASLAAREAGGSLAVHSDGPEKGATFTLELPLKPEVGNESPSQPPALGPKGHH